MPYIYFYIGFFKINSVNRDSTDNWARVFVQCGNLHIFVIDVMIMMQSIYHLPKHKAGQ